MEESTVNLINFAGNTSGADNPLVGGGDSQTVRSLFDSFSSANNPDAGNSPLPGGGINPFAGEGGSQLQQLIFDRLKLVLGDDFFNGGNNPFTGGASFIPGDGSNSFPGGGSPPFNESNAPIGNGNKNLGISNAILGNFNSDYGNNSATIGNGNWNFNGNNAIIGNGNWLFAGSNTVVGNGNWYWDYGSNNATLGNGNWHFGSNNSTIGNGNWDFGNNNTIVGNGNWIFTNNNTIVGNGNWLVDNPNTTTGIDNSNSNNNSSDLFPEGFRTNVDNLINSIVGKIGEDFQGLTGNFGVLDTQTYNRLILSRGNDTNNNDISVDIQQLLASLSGIPNSTIPSVNYPNLPQPGQHSQPVPEPSSVMLAVAGFACLLLLRLKKRGIANFW